MLTLRFHPGEDDFILQEKVALPIIENDDEVLIKVEYAGLCGTAVIAQWTAAVGAQYVQRISSTASGRMITLELDPNTK